LTDQEALHNSTVAVKNMPRPGALLNLDPRSMFLGWTELPREAHEDGYWCISFVNRETHRIKAGRSARTWQGASNTSINRLLRSLRPSDQKPRHPVTCSTCAGEYAGSSRVDTARAGLSTKTWSAGMLTCSGAAVSKSVWFCFFGRRAVSAFLGSCDDSQKFTAAPVCPLPARVMHHRRRKRWASRGITVWRD
jgi:hypothetical protein